MLSTQEIIARVWESIRNNASTAEVVSKEHFLVIWISW